MKNPPESYNAGVRKLAELGVGRAAIAEGLQVDPRRVSAFLQDTEYLTNLKSYQADFFAANGLVDLQTIRGSAPATIGSSKILTVDDQAEITALTARQLQRFGFESVVANSGEQALKILRDPAIAVLLLDWNMPEIGGLQVLRRLEAVREGLPMVEAILITASTDQEVEFIAAKFGVPVIHKPLSDFTALADVVDVALARYRSRIKDSVQTSKAETQTTSQARLIDHFTNEDTISGKRLRSMEKMVEEIQRTLKEPKKNKD